MNRASRFRRSRLLAVLALLIGALGLFGSASAQPAAPGVPTGLTVTVVNSTSLNVSWTAPSGTVTDYDVNYTRNATVGLQDNSGPGAPESGWLHYAHGYDTASRGPTRGWVGTSIQIRHLRPGTAYRVRVRAKNTNVAVSNWVGASATTSGSAPTFNDVWWGCTEYALQAEDRDCGADTIIINSASGDGGSVVARAESPYAELIAQMRQWRNDPQWAHLKEHTDRWDRALLAFGETVSDTSLTAMTAAEAQGFADRGWSRWVDVAGALQQIESGVQQAQPQQPQQPDPQPQQQEPQQTQQTPPQHVHATQQQQPPPNRAPTVSAALTDAVIVRQSGALAVPLSGVFEDADGDALTISVSASTEAVATVSAASDGSSLTVRAQARGRATITVSADDGNGGAVSDAFTVTVKAAPQLATALADVSRLEAGATREVSLAGVFSDADGDALSLTAVSGDETKAAVSVSADGSALTLTGVAAGTATITVTAEDADGNRVSDSFEVNVVAAAEPEPAETETPDVVARYDANGNGAIDISEYIQARRDHAYRRISDAEWELILSAWLTSQYGS